MRWKERGRKFPSRRVAQTFPVFRSTRTTPRGQNRNSGLPRREVYDCCGADQLCKQGSAHVRLSLLGFSLVQPLLESQLEVHTLRDCPVAAARDGAAASGAGLLRRVILSCFRPLRPSKAASPPPALCPPAGSSSRCSAAAGSTGRSRLRWLLLVFLVEPASRSRGGGRRWTILKTSPSGGGDRRGVLVRRHDELVEIPEEYRRWGLSNTSK